MGNPSRLIRVSLAMVILTASTTALQGQPVAPSAQGGSLASLQGELASLNAQLAGLKVESDRLQRQLRQGAGPATVSVQVQVRSTEVSLEMARIEGEMARVQAQIAAKQAITSSGSVPPLGGPFNGVDPEMVTGMAFILALALVIPLSIGLTRRFVRGGARSVGPGIAEIAPRLDRLEQAVDSIAIEVERISEGQRFVTKILADQPQIQASVNAGKPPSSAAGNNL
jgi:hypothetical protein